MSERFKWITYISLTLNDWVKSKGLKVILLEENSNPKYDIKDIDEFMEKYKV